MKKVWNGDDWFWFMTEFSHFPQESRLSKVKRMITGSILMGRRKKESEGEKENSGDGSGGCTGGRMEMEGVAVCIRKESSYGEALKELHIEVAASATTEIVLKPRKRKERLDSGGSLNQAETKVCFATKYYV